MGDAQSSRVGTIVWYDLLTHDADAAWEFYGSLFGWRQVDTERPAGRYAMIRRGDRNLGGIVPLKPGDGFPSHWIAYVSVTDLEACCRAASEAGGRVPVPPTDIPGIGRFAVVLDPQGAAISPFQTETPPSSPRPDGTGAFCWMELLTPDTKGAGEFYGSIFGWELKPGRPGALGDYWTYRKAGHAVAGMVERPAGADYPTRWLPYVQVEGLAEIAVRAARHGGSVLLPVTPIQDEGQFAILRDPSGAVIGIFEADARTGAQPAL
jgi:predicted enzyme related to lactoylglutathione lyase